MAVLFFEDGSSTKDLNAIQDKLLSLGVSLNRWEISDSSTLELLKKETLDEEQKERTLAGLDHRFEDLKKDKGYVSRDLIVLSPSIPNLDELLKKFERAHNHSDDEVRYIVEGEGVFGFVMPDKSQVELKVEALDYINVPKNTEHWFRLTEKKRIKAVRYFSGIDGWSPEYTDTTITINRK